VSCSRPADRFALGGWLFRYADDGMDTSAAGFDGKDRQLVLGRRTMANDAW